MLHQTRAAAFGRRKGTSTVEYTLLLTAIAALVALVAFAFGSYLHSALRPACAGPASPQPSSTTCAPSQP